MTLSKIGSLCAEHGMPTGSVGEYVNVIADRHAYNPVADWIGSKPWDGRDRFPEVNATIIEQQGYPLKLKEVLTRKWFRSAAAAALVPHYKGRGVLTFQGQQGIGKTSWVKALVSDPELRDSVVKLDHHLDGGNKDSILGAIGNWIVEIGELESSFKRDIARLKGYITSDSDRVRRPYARAESVYPRRTLFVATVNGADFLVDTTGNSRWWTIAVDSLIYDHDVDMQQFFAQMAAEVEDGETWWLDRNEEALLAEWNGRHVATSVVADMVNAWLDLEAGAAEMRVMTSTQVLKAAGIERPTNPQNKECCAILSELFGPSRRIRGCNVWDVPYREPTSADLFSRPQPMPKPTRQNLDEEEF